MKRIRQFSTNPVLLVILCLAILFVSCSKDQLASQVAQYSGKDMMSAVFFADGPVLDKLPELKSAVNISLFITDAGQLEEVRSMYASILDKLEQKEPGAFDEFKRRMHSGDHIVINETIDNYGEKISSILKGELEGVVSFDKIAQNKNKFITIIKKYDSNPKDQYSAKALMENPKFNRELSNLYNDIREESIQGRISTTENASCVFYFAMLVAWVYVWWAVLAWTFFWSGNFIDWWGGAIERTSGRSLLKDQIINSIAVNLADTSK